LIEKAAWSYAAFFFLSHNLKKASYSISKSIVSMRRAADSASARQGEGNNDTIDLETELNTIHFVKGKKTWFSFAKLSPSSS
jgi:hypothetical protein